MKANSFEKIDAVQLIFANSYDHDFSILLF